MTRVNGEDGLTCGVPIADLAVNWDAERAPQMFEAIREDRTDDIGRDLCSPTGLPQYPGPSRTHRPKAEHARQRVHRRAMTYETLDYTVDDDGVLTLTLDRPEALNAFTVQMAEDLVAAFERASSDDAVAAVVVTGRGRAFCAGMDLSVEGNVFGLDETQRPTLDDLHDRLEDPEILDGVRDTGGRVTLAIYACTKPVIGGDQRRRGRHRRHHDAGHGRPDGLDQGAHRLRLRQDRHRPGGLLDLVPAPHRGHQPGAGARLLRRHPRRRRRPRGRAWSARCTSPTTCCRRPTRWRGSSPRTAPRWPPRWRGR